MFRLLAGADLTSLVPVKRMRLLTHVIFGAGSLVAVSPENPVELRLFLAVLLSIMVNGLIDRLGHVRRGGRAARSMLTHSLLTAPLWGGATGYIAWLAFGYVWGASSGLEFDLVASGVIIAATHLLLDSITERGVFLLTGRVALAHFSARNAALNWAFVLIGLALIIGKVLP